MGRDVKKTVEYYPHYIGDGKKMFTIQNKYKNDGYATWNKLLELLAKTENHYLDLSIKSELMFIASYCLVDEDKLLLIIDDITMLGEFDTFLWENRLIWCEKFIESIKTAYLKRLNPCIDRNQLISLLSSKGRLKIEEKTKLPKEKKEKEVSEDKPKTFDFKKAIIDLGATNEDAHVWMAVRLKKRSVNSEVALNGFIREVEKAGWTIKDAVNKCAVKSWASIEAKWLEDLNSKTSSLKTTHNNSGDGTNWDNELIKTHGSN